MKIVPHLVAFLWPLSSSVRNNSRSILNMSNCVSERRKVLLVGDSITQQSFSTLHGGWGAGLCDWYQRAADVTNRGYSGYNSRWIMQSMEQMFPASNTLNRDVILVTLFLGSNDAAEFPSTQHVPLEEYKSNMMSLISYFKASFPTAVILLITPPQVDNNLWPRLNIPQTSKYASIVRDLGVECDISVLDLWEQGPYRVELPDLRDGLHLGVMGNRKVCEGIQALIRSKHPKLAPEDLPDGTRNMSYHFPHHSILSAADGIEESETILKNWSW